MRTEQQIKSKINELKMQHKRLQERLSSLPPGREAERSQLSLQLERLEDMSLMLEWVLDAPAGSYHIER